MAVTSNDHTEASGLLKVLSPLAAGAEAVMGLSPWQRWALAALAGASSVLSLSPFFLVPVLFLTMPLFIWLLDGTARSDKPLRAAAAVGWWFGFGFHLAGLYWISLAFLVDAETYAWLLPFVAVLMPGGLALFTMGLGALYVKLTASRRESPVRIIDFALLWMVAEWLRGHIFTGLPWNLLGYAWGDLLPVAAFASYVGVYGLSLVTVLIASTPAAFSERPKAGVRFPVPLRGVSAAFSLLVVLFVVGALRLGGQPTAFVEGVALRLVQPSIPQAEKWKPENRRAIFETYLQMSAEAHEGIEPTLLIWPESAVPLFLQRQPVARRMIGELLPPEGALLTGAVRLESGATPDDMNIFNSVLMLDPAGEITASYDKYHLVPFGEYMPASDLMSSLGIGAFVPNAGSGFSAGPAPQTLDVPGAGRVLPMICYEVIFPMALRPSLRGEARPTWILNVTNDAWYGDSTGPRQHLTQAQFRAIELGLPLVRSANTGISAVFDPMGREVARLGLDERGVLDVGLPAEAPPSLYSRLGDLLFFGCFLGLSALSFGLGRRVKVP